MTRKTSRSQFAAPADVHYQAGRIAFENRKFEEAAAHLLEATSLAPSGPMLELLGEVLISLGRLDDAIGWLERATLATPKSYRAFYLLGRACRMAERTSASGRAFRRALALNPHYRKAREELELLLPDDDPGGLSMP